MSQCALHFNSDFQNNLKEFYSLLGKDGKGFASLNLTPNTKLSPG